VVWLVAGLAYAVGAATTTPFSTAANMMTAVPIVALVALAVARWPLRPRPEQRPTVAGHPYRAWLVLLALVVAMELFEYVARGSRATHPTLSSMADAVDRYRALKVVLFFGWLWLGAAIVRAGRAATRTPSAPSGQPRQGS
jgi:hypothetical protein